MSNEQPHLTTGVPVAATQPATAAQQPTLITVPVAFAPVHKHAAHEESAALTTRLTYFIVGGAIGATIALLFAPKPGRELRGDIADATRKGVDRTRETATQVGTKAGEYYEVTRERAAELYSTAATKAGEVAARKGEQLSAAIEAGKQAYADEKRRAEIFEGMEAPTYPKDGDLNPRT